MGEEAVEFEHRDLHWGNLLIRRVPVGQRTSARLRCVHHVLDPLVINPLITVPPPCAIFCSLGQQRNLLDLKPPGRSGMQARTGSTAARPGWASQFAAQVCLRSIALPGSTAHRNPLYCCAQISGMLLHGE